MNSKTLSLLALCFTVSLSGCGKNNGNGIPEPTKETCSLDYQKKHHLTALTDYESFTYPDLFNNPFASEKSFDRAQEIEDELKKPFQHYYNVCEKIPGSWQYNQDAKLKKEHEEFIKQINYDASHVLEPVPNVTNITYPKPSKETCSDKYVNSHPELKKAIDYALKQLWVEGKLTKKEMEKAYSEAKAKNFKDLDAIADLLKPKALGDFYKNCARYPD